MKPQPPQYFLRITDNMSHPKALERKELFRLLGGDRRYVMESTQRFQTKNRALLEFLGIYTEVNNYGNSVSLQYRTSNYVGAIPTVLPDGSQGGDLQVYPHLGNGTQEDGMVQLTELLHLIDQTVAPEFIDSLPLRNQLEMQPPLFYEAIKYIDLYQKALQLHWRKFLVEKKQFPYPKGATDWNKYAKQFANPEKRLVFPTHDNVLSVNHTEWQQLKYVFQLAASELTSTKTPRLIRARYQYVVQEISQKTKEILPKQTINIPIHASDPMPIKALKQQAEVILSRQKIACTAWRIDIAEVFERFVQYVLSHAAQRSFCSAKCISNQKFIGKSHVPAWGLKHLEPDILITVENQLIIADAKYKANMYALGQASDILKETHRHDLHQILAYCAFAPQQDKLALLCYPAPHQIMRIIFAVLES